MGHNFIFLLFKVGASSLNALAFLSFEGCVSMSGTRCCVFRSGMTPILAFFEGSEPSVFLRSF